MGVVSPTLSFILSAFKPCRLKFHIFFLIPLFILPFSKFRNPWFPTWTIIIIFLSEFCLFWYISKRYKSCHFHVFLRNFQSSKWNLNVFFLTAITYFLLHQKFLYKLTLSLTYHKLLVSQLEILAEKNTFFSLNFTNHSKD